MCRVRRHPHYRYIRCATCVISVITSVIVTGATAFNPVITVAVVTCRRHATQGLQPTQNSHGATSSIVFLDRDWLEHHCEIGGISPYYTDISRELIYLMHRAQSTPESWGIASRAAAMGRMLRRQSAVTIPDIVINTSEDYGSDDQLSVGMSTITHNRNNLTTAYTSSP